MDSIDFGPEGVKSARAKLVHIQEQRDELAFESRLLWSALLGGAFSPLHAKRGHEQPSLGDLKSTRVHINTRDERGRIKPLAPDLKATINNVAAILASAHRRKSKKLRKAVRK